MFDVGTNLAVANEFVELDDVLAVLAAHVDLGLVTAGEVILHPSPSKDFLVIVAKDVDAVSTAGNLVGDHEGLDDFLHLSGDGHIAAVDAPGDFGVDETLFDMNSGHADEVVVVPFVANTFLVDILHGVVFQAGSKDRVVVRHGLPPVIIRVSRRTLSIIIKIRPFEIITYIYLYVNTKLSCNSRVGIGWSEFL